MRFSRWCRVPWVRALLAGLYVVALAAAVPHGAGGHARQGDWTSEEARRFWGPTRMSDAAGDDSEDGSGTEAARRRAAQRITTSARHFAGVPTVGVIFYVGQDLKDHHCTASVVHSPKGNLIITAGHCGLGDDAAFVPGYRSGADRQPYGIWPIDRTFTDPRRDDYGDGSDLDVAFATVTTDERGRPIERVTGANRLVRTPGFTNVVTVVGYPASDADPADQAVRCTALTSRLEGHQQMKMRCDGFYSGTSGSPWFTRFDDRKGVGDIAGVLGGLNGGGPDGEDSDRVSYSPLNGDDVFALYLDAINGREPRRD
ncbi:hypothetical protein [Streptomyces sp. NPDC049585]|uniref:trypsin-like serine peptidase n=1 Tax=Streptomyces sp. NPDC049585 TaxID=3155154 RepID=UPI0034401F53